MKVSLQAALIIGSVFLWSSSAWAAEEASVLFSGGGDGEEEWKAEFCDSLSATLSVDCIFDSEGDAVVEKMRDSGDYRYHARLAGNEDGKLTLSIDDLDRRRPVTEILTTESSLEDDPRALKVLDRVERNIIDGPIGSHTTPGNPPKYWRAAAWHATAQAIATYWYFSAGELNSKDWDYNGLYSDDPELRPQSEVWKNFGGWRFDDNVMYLNTPLHPMAGAGYHILGRANDLGFWGSILASNIVSMVWEAGIEHQEVIAVNDLIMTGVAGIPLGEAYYQLGQFFRSAERTPFNQAMSWIFATHMQLNDLIDGNTPLYMGSRGDFGWPEGTWHRFVLQPGYSASSMTDADDVRYDGEFAASAELVRLPNFGRSGQHSRWVSGTLASQLWTSFSMGAGDVYNWKLGGDLDMAGYYHHLVVGDAGEEAGASFFAGTGLAFRHIQHRYGDTLDRYGIAHLPGLVFDGSWFSGPVDLRLRYGVYPDFSNIDSHAYTQYQETTGRRAGRTVLDDESYYFGWGLSSLLRMEADIAPLHLHWNWNMHWARSIDSLDRFQENQERFGQDLDGYLAVTDYVSHHEVGAMFSLPFSKIRAGVIGEVRHRRGTVDDDRQQVSVEGSDVRGLGVLQLLY